MICKPLMQLAFAQIYHAGNRLAAVDQMFDFFQLFQLIGTVEASSPAFVRWTEAVASFPSAQAFNRDASKCGNAAYAIEIVWYSFGHNFVQVQRVDKNTDIFEFVQIGLRGWYLI